MEGSPWGPPSGRSRRRAEVTPLDSSRGRCPAVNPPSPPVHHAVHSPGSTWAPLTPALPQGSAARRLSVTPLHRPTGGHSVAGVGGAGRGRPLGSARGDRTPSGGTGSEGRVCGSLGGSCPRCCLDSEQPQCPRWAGRGGGGAALPVASRHWDPPSPSAPLARALEPCPGACRESCQRAEGCVLTHSEGFWGPEDTMTGRGRGGAVYVGLREQRVPPRITATTCPWGKADRQVTGREGLCTARGPVGWASRSRGGSMFTLSSRCLRRPRRPARPGLALICDPRSPWSARGPERPASRSPSAAAASESAACRPVSARLLLAGVQGARPRRLPR